MSLLSTVSPHLNPLFHSHPAPLPSPQRAKDKREQVGVELYGAQQQLANLQMALETSAEKFDQISAVRAQAEEDAARLRKLASEQSVLTKEEERRVTVFQRELNKLSSTLKQIEHYNEKVQSEIAVTRRATYAAEEAAQKMEKEKLEQDLLIDRLQETLKTKHQQLSLLGGQLEAQKKETSQALETLNEASSEMEAIHFEKKQLANQWKSTLMAVGKRDDALASVKQAIQAKEEEALTLSSEIEGLKKDIIKEQQRNETLSSMLQKLQGEGEHLQKKIAESIAKQEAVKAQYLKLIRAQEEMQKDLDVAEAQGKTLTQEVTKIDRSYVMTHNKLKELDAAMLMKLSEQTTLEKGAQKAIQETKKVQVQVQQAELEAIGLQNEVAKINIDMLNTQMHNDSLEETLARLDADLKDRSATIDKYQQELRRRNDEIDKKAKYVDQLNKQYDRLTANVEDENVGPLEATIRNLQKEITQKGNEGKSMQRRWIQLQTQLVGTVNDNSALEEKIARQKAEQTVVYQKRQRMEKSYELAVADAAELDKVMNRMQHEMTRINELKAKHASLHAVLQDENFNLESAILNELRDMEQEASRLESKIEANREEKRALMAEIVEAERHVMLWERKLELEEEMRAAIDPSVGNEVVTAMKKEIHRMKLRLEELIRTQEKLMSELERGIVKRDIITTKGKSLGAKKGALESTVAGAKKQVSDLKKSIRETEKEAADTEIRVKELEEMRGAIAEECERVTSRCHALRQEDADLAQALATAQGMRTQALMQTTRIQRLAKRYEDAISGRYRPVVSDLNLANVEHETRKEMETKERVVQALTALRRHNPDLEAAMGKLMAQLTA